jgi:hypothetical protein
MNKMTESLIGYIIFQVIAIIPLGYKIEKISDDILNNGLSLYYLIFAILFLPALIIIVLTILTDIGLDTIKDWLNKQMSKLKNIKICKFK